MSREKKADEKFCAECGEIIRLKAEICPKCGCRQVALMSGTGAVPGVVITEEKSRTTAAILAIFLGGLGLHKFYLGKPLHGAFYILFCLTFIPALIGLIEGVHYLLMTDAEFKARLEQGKLEHFGGTFAVSSVTPETHVKCPDCRALIPNDAKVCQHCNCKLIPQ